MDSKLRTETLCIQAGYTPGNGEPRQLPIIQSTTFKYATSEDMGKLFDLEADGYFYSRRSFWRDKTYNARDCFLRSLHSTRLRRNCQEIVAFFSFPGTEASPPGTVGTGPFRPGPGGRRTEYTWAEREY